jgi:hypothetical protein
MNRKIRSKTSFRQVVIEDTQSTGSPVVLQAPTYRDIAVPLVPPPSSILPPPSSHCAFLPTKKEALFSKILL